jgi:hypothetical protein
MMYGRRGTEGMKALVEGAAFRRDAGGGKTGDMLECLI